MKIINTPINSLEGLLNLVNNNTGVFVKKFNKQAKTNKKLTIAVVGLGIAVGMMSKRLDEQDKKIEELTAKLTAEKDEQKETVECD